MENYGPAVGSFFFGFIIGYTTRYFLQKFDSFKIQGLMAVIGILTGAAAYAVSGEYIGVWWWLYPVGLTVGFIVYVVLAVIAGAKMLDVVTFRPNDNDEK